MIRRPSLLGLALALPVLLAGCGGENVELDQWMQEVRKEMRPLDTSVAEPKTYVPYLYQTQGIVSPFDTSKVSVALAKMAANTKSPLAPNLERRKEPLEAFPLDTITMVGVMESPKLKYALLRVGGLLYQVKVGNYVGQNFGMITRIGDTEITLREVVQDATGDWAERISTMQLQEKR